MHTQRITFKAQMLFIALTQLHALRTSPNTKELSPPSTPTHTSTPPNRAKVFGPYTDNVVPSHLKGEYPGDYGFDPVGLCADPERFEFLRQVRV